MFFCKKKNILSSTVLISSSWMRKQVLGVEGENYCNTCFSQNRNGKDHASHHFTPHSLTPTHHKRQPCQSGEEGKCAKWKGSTQKYLSVLKYWLPPQMVQEKLRFQGTRITLPAQNVQCLTRFLCKEMSTAVMPRHIRKTLKCNQALPGVWGFSGINKLCHPVGFRWGKSSIINVCCPLCQKNEMKCCSGVRCPEHKMPEAASLETKKSQQSTLLKISRPVSFVERAGFLLDPQSSVTKGAVIWTLDNDHSVFNEIQTHMDIFFP